MDTARPVHVPHRRCIACGRRGPQAGFVRVKLDESRSPALVVIDGDARRVGRGAYVCPRRACLDRAVRKHLFARAFGRPVTVAVDELLSGFEAEVDEAT